jgi:type II secretory pathway component PulM
MIRQLFETRRHRERILIAALSWAVVLLWLVVFIRSYREHASQLRAALSEVRTQDSIIASTASIEENLAAARKRLDPAKTIGAMQLSSTVDTLSRNAGLMADIASPVRRDSSIFTVTSVRVSIRDASMDQLINFANSVRANSPYIAILGFKLSASQRDPHQLSAEFEIESIELNNSL